MELNVIQQMMVDTGMLEIKLPVKSDNREHQVLVNGIECTYCQQLEWPDEIHIYGDTDMCESCYQGMVE